MKNIDTAFRFARKFNMLFLAACLVLCCFTVYQTNRTLAANRGKVFIMVNGKLVEALARERDMPVELRDHIRDFHRLFLTLSPDDKAIEGQIGKALYLADESARRQYRNMKEAGYYAGLIAGNISQTIRIDSIELDTGSEPYRFRCTGIQTITRPTSILTRSLVTGGRVRTGLVQSDNNAHGFLIEDWEIIENRDINVKTR